MSKELNKEIEKVLREGALSWNISYCDMCFIAENFYELGKKDMKEQMMEEAVDADVNIYRDLAAGKSWAEFVVEMPTNNLGDKVRIIIIKEDKK